MRKTGRGVLFVALCWAAAVLVTAACLPGWAEESPKADRSDLQVGTYVGQVHQTATAKTDGTTVEDELPFRLTILRIAADGRVQARVAIQRHSGDLSGTVDAQNRLHLEGTLTHSVLPGKWEFKLDALAREETLLDGTYTKESPNIRSKGTLAVARLEK